MDLELKGLYYLSPTGGRYKGLLTITKTEFLFVSEFDQTFEILNQSNLRIINQKKTFSLEKEEISSVEFKRTLLKDRIILSKNGKAHVFMGFMLSKNKVFNAFKNY